MKVRKSEATIIQESQDNKSAKGAGKSPRATNSSTDTVEMSSANRETSGQRELTTDEQAKAPRLDPENYTALLSGTDPRAAIEASRSKHKPSSPQQGTGTLPNGKSSGPDLSQYNVPTSGAPAMLKDSIGQLGSRAEQLKGLAGNKTEMLDPFALANRNNRGEARDYMNAKDGELTAAWNWVKGLFTDEVKQEITEEVIDQAIDKTGKTGSRVLPVLVEPLTGPGGVVTEVMGEEGPKNYLDGWKALLGGQPFTGSQSGAVKDPGPPDLDGGQGGSGRGGTLIDGHFTGGQILQGITGKGPGGGEVVNPSPEGTGGGKGPFVDNSPQLTQENANYLIGQPEPGEQKGFNGLSGSGTPQGNGGAIDFLDKSGWTGPTRTEEPGDVHTGPTGDLSHLIQKNEDDDDGRK